MSSVLSAQHRTVLFALFVLCCTLVAVYLRLDFHPDTYYGDEEIPIAVVQHMEKNHTLDTNWAQGIWRKPEDRWAYGYDQYNFSSYNSVQYYLNRVFQVGKNNSNPAQFNRVCSVVFQSLTLIIICYAIHYLIGTYGAIAAALFFVVNPLLLVDAHYARPESFLMLITALAVFFHLFAVKEKKPLYFFASAFMWGIACACKFSLLPMAALCCLHFFIHNRRHKNKFSADAIWLLLFTGGAFVLAPYLFIHADKVAHGVRILFQQYFNSTSASTVVFERSDLLLPKYLLGYFGAAFWFAILLSVLHLNPFLKCLAVFLLATVLFYIAVFSLLSFFNESNLSHLAVIWCLSLAIAVEACVARAANNTKYIKTFFVVIVAAIITTPALCAFKIRNEVYAPGAAEKIQQLIADAEKNLVAAHPGAEIIDITKQPAIVDQIDRPLVIIRVPWVDRNELYTFAQKLSDKHFLLIDEISLPLKELPHSQLQSIHFPASYRYYQRTQNPTGE